MTTPQQYDRAARPWHWTGVPAWQIEAARDGTNTECVECRRLPLDGGLRCGRCFAGVTGRRRKVSA